jgi:hypothetical protein
MQEKRDIDYMNSKRSSILIWFTTHWVASATVTNYHMTTKTSLPVDPRDFVFLWDEELDFLSIYWIPYIINDHVSLQTALYPKWNMELCLLAKQKHNTISFKI